MNPMTRSPLGFYRIRHFGFMDYRVVDVRTGNIGASHRSRQEAIIAAHGLRIRNMQHD